MPSSSSFFLKAGAVLSALSTTSATVYTLQDNFQGDSFLDGFTFFDKPDPTNGFVTYVFNYFLALDSTDQAVMSLNPPRGINSL